MEWELNSSQERSRHHSPNPIGAIVNVYLMFFHLDSVAVLICLLTWCINFWLVWKAACWERVMKMDKLSLQVSLLHYSKLPIWKGSEIQCLGILCAIDLLKHLVEEAEALEGDRMWVLCEMRWALSWRRGNMRALWCEIVHRCDLRVLETDGGGGCQPELKWQVSRGQSDTRGPALNLSRIPLAISTGFTFHTLFSSKFLWSKTASSTPAHHSSGSLSSLCVEEIRLRCKGTFSPRSVCLLF